jgi:hypothetical protein
MNVQVRTCDGLLAPYKLTHQLPSDMDVEGWFLLSLDDRVLGLAHTAAR